MIPKDLISVSDASTILGRHRLLVHSLLRRNELSAYTQNEAEGVFVSEAEIQKLKITLDKNREELSKRFAGYEATRKAAEDEIRKELEAIGY